MFITLVAVLCQIASSSCVEEIITDQASLMACQIQGQIGIADWMSKSSTYRTGWRLERYKCAMGHYERARAS
jgi:hypothetical protein